MMGTAIAALILAAGVTTAAAAEEAAPKPVYSVHADPTFIDDAFALSPHGDRLAYVRTDAADIATVEIVAVSAGRVETTFSIASFTRTPERLAFTNDGEHVVVIAKDPSNGRRAAQVFDLRGKTVGKRVGPAFDVAVTPVGGQTALVALQAHQAGASTTYDVAAVRASDGHSLGKRSLKADAQGTVKVGEGLRVLYWTDGYTKLVGQKKGEYDKKGDIRRPDRASVFDVLGGKELGEQEIGDVIGWVREVKQRESYPNQTACVLFSEDSKTLELLTSDHRRVKIETPRPLQKYDPKSLAEQPGAEPTQLYFSVMVDPVNRDAVARQKTDLDVFDLYALDIGAAGASGSAFTPRRVLSGIVAQGRPLAWSVAGGRVAVLHKHKGFDRGGTDLEVYDLGN